MPDLAPIAGKLAKYIRLLGSDKEGECEAARAAMERTLESHGFDFTDLGHHVEQPADGKYTEVEVEQICQVIRKQAVEEGIKIGKAQGGNSNGAAPPLPSPVIMAAYCHQRRDRLNDWEREFIDNMHVRGVARRFTLKPKQKSKLQEIYQQLGGT